VDGRRDVFVTLLKPFDTDETWCIIVLPYGAKV